MKELSLNISIRPIQPKDYQDVKYLLNADTNYHVDLDANFKRMFELNKSYFDNELENTIKNSSIIIAEVSDDNIFSKVVGILSYRKQTNGSIYISDLYVQESYRKLSIGTKLLDYVKNKHSNTPIELMCLVKNTNAYKFYTNYGFTVKRKVIGKHYKIEDYEMIYTPKEDLQC